MTRRHGARARRVFFATHDELPQPCSYCGDLVAELGRQRMQGVIHHVNEIKDDDRPENLQLMHHLCHRRHHTPATTAGVIRYWQTITPEERTAFAQKCSDTQQDGKRRGWDSMSEERKQWVGRRISDGKKGRPRTDSTFECSCGRMLSRWNLQQHQRATGHA